MSKINPNTPKQFEIAEMIASGMSDEEISLATGLSYATVKTYKTQLFGEVKIRLGLPKMTRAIFQAYLSE